MLHHIEHGLMISNVLAAERPTTFPALNDAFWNTQSIWNGYMS